ncbi:MAG: hypothetical protein GC185_02335 [Alphaproteobacteria bacterium]|nr:hypothetical protein [Alphaproteobacteria bacterium]
MSSYNDGALTGAFGSVATKAADAEMQLLDSVLRPLTASGFEFRGGDMFGQEIYGIYVNDAADEFVVLRYNRASEDNRALPPLIHRGPMSELDTPMDHINSLEFKTVQEYMRAALPALPAAAPKDNKPGYPRFS